MSVTFQADCDGLSGLSVDVSNATARAMLTAVGLSAENPWGELPVDALPPVIARCLRLVNGGDLAVHAVPPSSENDALRRSGEDGNVIAVDRGCQFHDSGVSEERLHRRCSAFLTLLTEARKSGVGVHWG